MDLLRQLTQTPGISGREDRIRELILRETRGLFDQTRIDPMGSLIGLRHPRPPKGSAKSGRGAKAGARPPRIMLAAHMDQIGFMVKHIDDKGFIRLNAVGGFDPRNLFARTVLVCPDPRNAKGDLPGVMNPGGRPIHIATDEDRKKTPEVSDMLVDLGLPAVQVQKKVSIGDMVVIQAPFQEIGQTVVAQALDNRVACWIAIEALRKLEAAGAPHACEIHCVFTVQEEVGLRGAMTAAFEVKPDIGIALDTTLCVDTPGVPDDQRVTKQGEGAALTFMDGATISDWDLARRFEAIARKRRIKAQRSILPRGGTDAGAMQRAASGARAFTLSCPTRYIHTVTEMVHKTDLFACRDLLAAFLEEGGT